MVFKFVMRVGTKLLHLVTIERIKISHNFRLPVSWVEFISEDITYANRVVTNGEQRMLTINTVSKVLDKRQMAMFKRRLCIVWKSN